MTHICSALAIWEQKNGGSCWKASQARLACDLGAGEELWPWAVCLQDAHRMSGPCRCWARGSFLQSVSGGERRWCGLFCAAFTMHFGEVQGELDRHVPMSQGPGPLQTQGRKSRVGGLRSSSKVSSCHQELGGLYILQKVAAGQGHMHSCLADSPSRWDKCKHKTLARGKLSPGPLVPGQPLPSGSSSGLQLATVSCPVADSSLPEGLLPTRLPCSRKPEAI